MTVLCDSLSDQKIDQIKVVKNIRPVLSKTKVLGPILQTFYGRNYATSGVFLYDRANVIKLFTAVSYDFP
jgi:hypothetical protein